MRFQPLASSSSGCAYLVQAPGADDLLIDAGLPFRQLQRLMNFRTSTLAGVLVSHSHGDHCRGVSDLIKTGVNAYASPETWGAMERDARLWGCLAYRRRVLSPEIWVEVGSWRVLGLPAVHDAPGTLSFLIDAPDGGRLFYVTDSAYTPYRAGGLTHIAVEANWSEMKTRERLREGSLPVDRYRRTSSNHMSIERAIEMLLANDLSQVEEIWLLHLSDDNSDEREFTRRVQQATGKRVCVAPREVQV